MLMEDNRDIQFIARHYRKGGFAVGAALRRMGLKQSSWWTPLRIAAASLIIAVSGATAGVLIHEGYFTGERKTTAVHVDEQGDKSSVSRIIDFENTPLTVVIARIGEVYDVEVINMPDNPDSYILSLHYEGNAIDLVETINEILGTEMEVR